VNDDSITTWIDNRNTIQAQLKADGYYAGTCNCGANFDLHIGHTRACADLNMLRTALQ
jgi:hypothetical protein